MNRIALALGVLPVAIYCTLAGALSLAAEITALPATRALEMRRQSMPYDRATGDRAVRAALSAADMFEPARHASLALELLLAGGAARSPAGVAQAVPLARQALAIDPASPHNWLRLAGLEHLSGNAGAARSAMLLSARTGPAEPDLMVPRLQLMQQTLRGGGWPEGQRLMRDQVALAARLKPGAAALLGGVPGMDGSAQAAIAADPALLRKYLRQRRAAVASVPE